MPDYFRGEYWIEDGEVTFADGDVGNFNHEGVAAERAASELADLCNVDYEGGDWEQLGKDLVEAAAGEVLDPEMAPDDAEEAAKVLLQANGKDPAEYADLIACALFLSGADPREYAMQHWGWIWCKDDWFGLATWDESTKADLVSGVHSILEDNGFYDGDEGDAGEEHPYDHELTIHTLDGKSLYLTLRQIETGESGERTEPPTGPSAQLRQMDVAAQPAHYGARLGDSRELAGLLVDLLLLECPRMETLKAGKVKLTDEERDEVMKAGAVWHHAWKDGEQKPSPGVWKSIVRGKPWYVCNTHRAGTAKPTLRGAIKAFEFIKTTA
jgi:hypothetical protein